MNIGDTVFIIDTGTKKVFQADITGISPSGGYLIVDYLDRQGKNNRTESAMVHQAKEQAENHLVEIAPTIDMMNEEADKANLLIDQGRESIIGKPDKKLLDLEERMKGKK